MNIYLVRVETSEGWHHGERTIKVKAQAFFVTETGAAKFMLSDQVVAYFPKGQWLSIVREQK